MSTSVASSVRPKIELNFILFMDLRKLPIFLIINKIILIDLRN